MWIDKFDGQKPGPDELDGDGAARFQRFSLKRGAQDYD
jgi:hypothetical protein